ncbi:SusC/RagA family TonB-linked outer membrane protein [Gaoshiqia sediminis]|uniref:SusC/RagA family TonB-linked outer membrane protein n=1 Tax=Gaoshiqia sediminis TaxID=2986998 RepID=A0AA41YCG3_9BACT|nr:SusC/RagA family TonB-linked outer membrane protein [Gaoshiqia sediminis]MCW0483923.1 SusC/RagA family TonB-linked outer membrane protein [Gaoshiqia sediminis]
MKFRVKNILPIGIIICTLNSFNVTGQKTKISEFVDSCGGSSDIILAEIVENQYKRTDNHKNERSEIEGDDFQYFQRINGERTSTISQEKNSDQKSLFKADSIDINIGYGLKRSKNEITAAVSVINASDFPKSKTIIDPANALYGLAAGLQVLQNAGEPPVSPTFFVRGRGTFRDSSPLILVDGFEQPFSALSIEEIDNIVVLKDAASLAMYGQKGANGAILITTKRGTKKSLEVKASFEQSLTQPIVKPGFLKSPNYAKAVNEALTNDGLSPRYTSADIEAYETGNSPYLFPNVNWADEALRDFGTRSNLNLTFEGGGNVARYYTLVNYVRDVGIYANTNPTEDYDAQKKYGRFNFRSNLDIDITSKLLLKIDAAGNLVENNVPNRGVSSNKIFDAIYSIPSASFPVKTPDGSWGGTPIYDNNPLAILSSTGVSNPNEREISVGGTLQQDLDQLIAGMSVDATVRYNTYNRFDEGQSKNYSYQYLVPVRDNNGSIIDTLVTEYGQDTDLNFFGNVNSERTQSDVLVKFNYQRDFGNNTFKGTVFFHQNSKSLKGKNNTFHGQNFATNLHYGMAQKYFVDLIASYNGYSVLPPENRFGLFPAASVAWVISNEEFMSRIHFVDWLKFRASWGMNGDGADQLPNTNIYESSYSGGSGYWFQSGNNYQSGFEEDRLASPDFIYATAYTSNLGIDAKLFRKLDLSTDLFYSRRENILTDTGGGYSQVLGISPPMTSNGIVENKGVEATLCWSDFIGDVGYSIAGNFSFTRNKIIEINEQYRPFDYLQRTGRSVGQTFGLEAIGFFEDPTDISNSPFQSFGDVVPGDIKYKDQNGDNIINEYDEIPLGYAQGYPEIYYSISLGFSYKGFKLSALFQGTGNQSAFLNTPSVYWPLRNNTNISQYYYDRRWTAQTSGEAIYPRLTTVNNNNNFQTNSLWLKSRSYAKLRNLEVSYNFPPKLINSLNMESLCVYLSGRNLLSIDNIPVMDPEQLDVSYPLLRSYQIGLELKF